MIELPPERVLAVAEPREAPGTGGMEAVRRAAEHPLEAPPLSQFLASARNAIFVVNDATRPTPTAAVIGALADCFRGVRVSFLVATGAHCAPSPAELKRLLGRSAAAGQRVHVHESGAEKELVFLGATRRGTAVRLNRACVEADQIVLIGSVEPHYFAGYTGGRKSLVPGVAAFSTIEQNHRWALEPSARPLALDGNPVHEDLEEAVGLLVHKPIWSVQLVLDRRRRVAAAFAGDLRASFRAAAACAREMYGVPIPQRAEVVVAVARPPLDADLYQAHKALEHGRLALKEGGVLLLVAPCHAGIGPPAFYDLLAEAGSPAGVLEKVRAGYRLGYHKAARLAELASRAEVWAYTSLSPSVVRAALMKPVADLRRAVDEALHARGPDARVLFLLDAAMTVPWVRDRDPASR